MKKLLMVLLLLTSIALAATGWFSDFVIINPNGSGEEWYWIGGDPSYGTELNGTNFGAVSSLSITGADMKYWSDTQDRTGGAFYWQIKDASGNTINEGSDPYDFNEVIWTHNSIGGNDFQGTWGSEATGDPINVLTGLDDATTYQLHICAKSWGTGQGDSWLSNSGANYVATFTTPDGQVPITLASFSAAALNGSVSVTWVTESESENAHFLLYRDGEVIAQIPGAGSTTEPHSYAYTDRYVVPGRTYTYQLADVSFDGEETKHARVEVEVKAEYVGQDYNIGPAYPNPFNPLTVVPVNLAKEAVVTTTLYDMAGRPLRELQNGSLSAGSHAITIDGANLSTGIYFVRINVNNAINVQKIALMK
jgi:hypothetical protein